LIEKSPSTIGCVCSKHQAPAHFQHFLTRTPFSPVIFITMTKSSANPILSALLLLLLLTSSVSAEFIPKKSWAVRGYEAFHGDRKDVVRSKKPPPPPPKKAVSQKTDSPPPSGLTKAIWGVGVAALVAAVGGKALNGEIKPERALVEALSKHVVTVPAPRKLSSKIISNPDGATIPNEVFNLVKAIVGVGVLSLPAGVAAFGSAPGAFVPAGILIAVIGVLSGFGFQLIGKVCAYTGAKSYREAWAKTVGEGSSWIPAVSTTCKTFLACLAFSMVLADTFSSLLETPRNETLMGVTLLILLPLCLMKNLKSLAPFSLVGVLGMAYTALAMTLRWLDGSYVMVGDTQQGQFISQLAGNLRPRFGNLGMKSVFSPNALILVCMLSTAYMVRRTHRMQVVNAVRLFLISQTLTCLRFLCCRLISMLPRCVFKTMLYKSMKRFY
jgi:Transmembrane amino acid transporter protein